jgi:hypothetical protein
MVRMMVADLLAAMVAVSVLVCNHYGDDRPFLRPTARPPVSRGMAIPYERGSWRHGWPLVCLERSGQILNYRPPAADPEYANYYSPMRYAPIPRIPQPGATGETWDLNAGALIIDLLVGLAIVLSTAYATRRWLRTEMKWFQVSLLSLLMLPAVFVLVCLFAEPPGLVPGLLLAAFFWLGMSCTVYVTGVVIFGLYCAGAPEEGRTNRKRPEAIHP